MSIQIYKTGDVLFTKGRYEVILAEGEYQLRNMQTGITELKSAALPECIRAAIVYENLVDDAYNPKDWGAKKPQANPFDFSGNAH